MATNQYFNNHGYTQTQDMVEDLTIEFIQAMGMDVSYLPREVVKLDRLFGEDTLSKFSESYVIEMYWDGDQSDWGGQGRFFSKFGLQDQRQLELLVSRKRFAQEVTTIRPDIHKPRVGDIIWLDVEEKAAFNIVWVEEHSLQQRQLNRPYTWKLSLELLTYSHEDHETTIPDFNSIETNFDSLNDALNIPNADNDTIKTVSDSYKDHTITNPFGGF